MVEPVGSSPIYLDDRVASVLLYPRLKDELQKGQIE